MTRDVPKSGEIYKHFKGKFYKIICVGHHAETDEKLVVYQVCETTKKITSRIKNILAYIPGCWIYGSDTEPCVSPLNTFMSEVDHEKYPNEKQTYRFEKIPLVTVNYY